MRYLPDLVRTGQLIKKYFMGVKWSEQFLSHSQIQSIHIRILVLVILHGSIDFRLIFHNQIKCAELDGGLGISDAETHPMLGHCAVV